jgi:hypothetical protein
MNDNKQTDGILAAVVLTILTLTFPFCGVVNASNIKDSTRPFPDYPSKFEGCVASDENTLFAVSENEGMTIFGVNKLIQTPQNGVHGMVMAYSSSEDYGYMLSNKADGKLCVSDVYTDLSFRQVEVSTKVRLPETINKEHCDFAEGYSDICGTYDQLSRSVQSKGFVVDWQAINSDGNIETMFSGNGKAYRLTTNVQTGATIITGNGKSEFIFYDNPNKYKQRNN